MLDALLDACLDSLKLFPFLLLTYFFMEWLEHGAGEKLESLVAKAGKAGPAIGAILGVVPQCGFSGAAATLYAGRVVTLGTLVAIFLATSDEMLPILIAQAASPVLIGKLIAIKVVYGMAVGFVLDAILRKAGRSHEGLASKHVHDGHRGHDIHELCEAEGCECVHDECGCDHCSQKTDCALLVEHEHEHEHGHEHHHHGVSFGHLALSALRHSLHILIFIFIITFLINLVVDAGLEAALATASEAPLVSTVIAGVLGLIPNCAVSVGLTQLYLDGMLAGGALVSGLMSNAGIGLLVLMRTNNDSRENLRIMGVLLGVSLVAGILVGLFGIL